MNDRDDENNRNDTTDQAREVKNVPIFNGVAVERWRSCWRRWMVGVGVVEVEVEVEVVGEEVVGEEVGGEEVGGETRARGTANRTTNTSRTMLWMR
jgi:hypothetical protein